MKSMRWGCPPTHCEDYMDETEDVPGYLITNRCDSCAYRKSAINCEAFPGGIPLEILLGWYDHIHPYDVDGLSDNGLTYSLAEGK